VENNTLNEVLKAESEILARLALEKEQAGKRIAAARKETDENLAAQEMRLRREFDVAMLAARKNTEEKAAEVIHTAEARAGALAKLSDDTLQDILNLHLSRVLPCTSLRQNDEGRHEKA
jgi:vacuolar-type H+-ATPase subunit H